MNKFQGKITDIVTHQGISLVKVHTQENINFTSAVIDSPELAAYLKSGSMVNVLFKETEVIIAHDSIGMISLQNRIPCTIRSISKGVLFCKLELFCGDITFHSIITGNACTQLKLNENDKVIALIKTNEISLAPHD